MDMPFARLAAAAALLAATPAAADIKITDVKAHLFLERAGKLSDNIVGAPAPMNAPKGGLAGGDTATGLFIDLTFAGDKNGAPKYAAATVDLTQTGKAGQQIVTHKAFANFLFGPDGVEHKAIYLEGATCMPLVIDVHAGKTSKTATLDFSCKE